jgi:hypothetical protein
VRRSRDPLIVSDYARSYARHRLRHVTYVCVRGPGRNRRSEDVVQRGSAQGNSSLSWGDAKSPIPGQVYVTPQAARGYQAPAPQRGNRCCTQPNTDSAHGIPSQPSMSRKKGVKQPGEAHPRSLPSIGPAPAVQRGRPRETKAQHHRVRKIPGSTLAPCRSTPSGLMRQAIPVSFTIEPNLSK